MVKRTLPAVVLILLGATASYLPAADQPSNRASVGPVWSAAYSPDGRTLATGSGDLKGGGMLILWDVLTGKPRAWLHQSARVRAVAFSPDGEKVAIGLWVQEVRIYEARTGKFLSSLKGHTGAINSVAFSPDGKTLASASLDKSIVLWDVASCVKKHQLTGHEGWALGVAFFPDGKSLASAGQDAAVRIWDVATGKETQTLKDPAAPLGFEPVAISPDGKTIAVGSWDAKAYLWDVEKGAIRTVFRGHNLSVVALDFSPDGKMLATASGDYNRTAPGDVRLWALPSGDEIATFGGYNDSLWSVRFAPDGRTLATASRDQKVVIWETATGKERAKLDNGLELFDKTPPPAPTDKELEESWSALAGADGAATQLAVARLARSPSQSVPWLVRRMKPAVKTDAPQAKAVQEWIVKLDDDDFDTREKAVEELAKMGTTIRPALQKAFDDASSAEVRQRLTGILKKMGKGESDLEALRGRRALEALELSHTDAAKALLEELAKGAPDAALTRESDGVLPALGETAVTVPRIH